MCVSVCVCVCMYVCMYVHACVCVCAHVCMHAMLCECVYTHVYEEEQRHMIMEQQRTQQQEMGATVIQTNVILSQDAHQVLHSLQMNSHCFKHHIGFYTHLWKNKNHYNSGTGLSYCCLIKARYIETQQVLD